LTLRNERRLFDVTPPAFSPDGARCAVLDQLGDLRSYTFPELSLIASATCAAQDDESFTECIAFLDSHRDSATH
ncbi:MAG: hypothetical protein MN733_26095, partial [Nitrososphaera sp.]|nr:hypothetical protein [Nitrososphaera sp.]